MEVAVPKHLKGLSLHLLPDPKVVVPSEIFGVGQRTEFMSHFLKEGRLLIDIRRDLEGHVGHGGSVIDDFRPQGVCSEDKFHFI